MNRRSLLALIGLGATAAVLPPQLEKEIELSALEPCVLQIPHPPLTGGWCAPSEMIYEACEIDPSVRLDMPTISVRRGGIQFPIKG